MEVTQTPQAPQIPQAPPQNQPSKKRSLVKALFPLIVGVITFILVTNIFNPSSNFSLSGKDKLYINAAEDFISRILKNPYSATLQEAYVVEKDNYGRAIVYIDITAENSFGGTVRNQFYVCILEVDDDGGDYRHNGEFSYCEIPDTGSAGDIGLSYLKEMNNFGEPK